jgi:D-alanyl-D-alanine carboxypeptidase (penicillin-binding protein 5/6)
VASAVREMPNGKRRLLSVVLGTASREAARASQKLLNWGFRVWDSSACLRPANLCSPCRWKGKVASAARSAGALFGHVPKGEATS